MPDLVLRFGEMPTSKPLRAWLAASGADQIVVDPLGGWNEPSRRAAAMLRADPTELAAGWATRLGRGGKRRRCRSAWIEAEAARAGGRREALAEARPHRARPAPGPRRRPPRRRPRLHRLEHADPRPGGLPAAGEADALFLCNRGANGIDGLVSSGIGAAAARGRPTTIVTGDLGLLHDIGGLAALREVETPVRVVVIDNDGGGIFHFLPQAEALAARSSRRCSAPRAGRRRRGRGALRAPPPALDALAELPEALAAGTGLIEVATPATPTRTCIQS